MQLKSLLKTNCLMPENLIKRKDEKIWKKTEINNNLSGLDVSTTPTSGLLNMTNKKHSKLECFYFCFII